MQLQLLLIACTQEQQPYCQTLKEPISCWKRLFTKSLAAKASRIPVRMSVGSVGSAGIEGLQKSFPVECGHRCSDFKGLHDILSPGIAADVLLGCIDVHHAKVSMGTLSSATFVESAAIESTDHACYVEGCWTSYIQGQAADVLSGCAQGLQYEDRKQERNLSSAGTQGP